MKKLGLLIILAVSTIVIPYAAHAFGSGAEPPKAPKAPPTFVDEMIPEGKAIIYFYDTYPVSFALVFFGGSLVAYLPPGGYSPFVVDPGTMEFVLVTGVGGQSGPGIVVQKLKVDASAGQEIFVGSIWFKGWEVIPEKTAKADDGILYRKKVE